MGYLFWNCQAMSFHRFSQTLQTLATARGYFPEHDVKTMFLKRQHS